MILAAPIALAGRELRGAWMERGGWFFRTGYVGALLIAAACAWGLAVAQGGPDDRLSWIVREWFALFAHIQFALLSLFASLGAAVVASAKEKGTLDLLLVSPSRRFVLLAAPAAGQWGLWLVMLAAGLPVFFLVLPLGGVSIEEILSVHLILLGQLAGVAGFSALVGARIASPLTAALAVVGAIGFLAAAPQLGPLLRPSARWLWEPLAAISSFETLLSELRTVRADFAGSAETLLRGLGALVVFSALGGLGLERWNVRRQERRGRPGFWAGLRRRAEAASAPRILRSLFRPVLRMGDPLIRRECLLDRDAFFRLGGLAYIVTFTAAVLALCSGRHAAKLDSHLEVAGVAVLSALVFLGLRTVVATYLERSRGWHEVLVSSNVDPEDVVRARWAGFALRAALLLVVPLLYAGVMVGVLGSWPGVLGPFLQAAGGLALGLALYLSLVLGVSFVVRNPVVAMILILAGLLAVAFAGTLLSLHPVLLAVGGVLVAGGCLFLYSMAVRGFRRTVRPD